MFKTEYMICWHFKGKKNWEIVNGKEELTEYIADLIDNGVEDNCILIFDMDNVDSVLN